MKLKNNAYTVFMALLQDALRNRNKKIQNFILIRFTYIHEFPLSFSKKGSY